MFRNENSKFKDLRHRAAHGSRLNLGSSWLPAPDFIYPVLYPTADEQATSFFFQNFVLDDPCASRGQFDYLPLIYQKLKINSVLEETILALGLAGLANRMKASKVMMKANLRYNVAVRAVSSVLSEVEEAKADQTLIAVMLLSLYETITSEAPQSLKSWTEHIKGATSILRLRGEAQLHTQVGRQLFIQFRSQIFTTCLQRRLAVPEEIQEWSRVSKQYESIEELPASNLAEIAMQLCSLRSTMSDLRDYSNSVYVVSEGLKIDENLSEWVIHQPPGYFYNNLTIFQSCDEVYSDRHHIYGGICIATIWNNYRCLRIVLNKILIVQLLHLRQIQLDSAQPSDDLIDFYGSRIQASQDLLAQLTLDVCASVPFYFNYHKKNTQTQVQVPVMSGILLQWYLYTVIVAGSPSDTMRFWILEKLRAIAETMGIRNALGLVEVLKQKREVTVSGLGEGECQFGA